MGQTACNELINNELQSKNNEINNDSELKRIKDMHRNGDINAGNLYNERLNKLRSNVSLYPDGNSL